MRRSADENLAGFHPTMTTRYRDRLAGRTVLVTGASSGIGAHWARLAAAAGARVVLCARRADALDHVAADIAGSGGTTVCVAMDVASEPSVVAAYDAAERAFGQVDTILVNAGTTSSARATELSVEEFDRVMAVNLRGVFLTAREGARRLLAGGSADRGRMVLTSSVTAFKPDPGLSAYAASKAGVIQLGKVLAREWIRSGINVNMICPGYIATDINRDWFDSEAGQRQVGSFPRCRLMDLEDLDEVLLFLASDGARATTGAVITVDDGQSL